MVEKTPPSAVAFRGTLLYHALMLERNEHKPHVPRSDVSRDRVKLFKKYLGVPRANWGGSISQPRALNDFVCS